MARILVADDEPDIRTLVEWALRKQGHEVVLVDSGTAALEAVGQVLPDLVILDVNMPGMEGTKVARLLRAKPETARVAIILLTALANEADTLAGYAAGADDYVVKPFNPRALAAKVDALLARASAGAAPAVRPQGRVIAVAGPKGGSGRTTIAVNLALALSGDANGPRAILVDGSLALGDVGVHLDLRSEHSLLDLIQYSGHLDVPALEAVLVRHRSGLRVLLRPGLPEQAASITESLWDDVLRIAAAIADLLIIDLDARYDDERTLLALEMATVVLLVVTPEIGAVQNGRHFLDLAPKLGIEPNRIHVVLNRMHDRVDLSAKEIAAALGVSHVEELPDIGPAATGYINHGTPIVLADSRAELSRRLRRLATSLVEAGHHAAGAKGDRR